MIIRTIVLLALIALAAGFLWFIAQVMMLGLKAFFKQHITNADHRKQRGRTAPNKRVWDK